jgi:hypothetical protein
VQDYQNCITAALSDCISQENRGATMKLMSLGTWAAAVAALGMILPPSVMAAAPAATEAVTDIALRPGGVLLGQVVDPQGAAKAGSPVAIELAGKEVVRTTTDENGVFAAQGLRGGVYQIKATEGISTCRLWAADTAPPAARPAALVVSGQDLIRAQYGPFHAWKEWIKAHPYITAGTVVAAIATPLALADDDWDSGS